MILPLNSGVMTASDWLKTKFFSRSEPWGNPDIMSRELIEALEDLRKHVSRPIIVHCGTQGQHNQNSFHYRGMAVDVDIPGMTVLDQFFAATRFQAFRGIGVYPSWNNPGLHLDVRPLASREPRARWLRDKAGNEWELSESNLRKIQSP